MQEKNNKGFIWLIIILIVLVLGLVGYIIYDKILKYDIPITNITTTTTITTTNIKTDLSNAEKEWEKEKITVYNDIINMLDEFIKKEFNEYDIKFNYDYMDDIIAKNNIVISAMMDNDKIKKDVDVDVNNVEITGAITFEKNDFINMYNTIIGEQPDFNKIINVTENTSKAIEVKDDKISGSYVTGASLYMIKLNDIVCSNTEYSLKLDYVYESEENSNIISEKYTDYEKTKTFDDDLINALIDINLNKNSNGTYKINYLRVIKK